MRVLTLAALFGSAATCSAQLQVIDLGIPDGGTESHATAVNNSGVIAIQTLSQPYLRLADGTTIAAGLPVGFTTGRFRRLNASGVAIGTVTQPVPAGQNVLPVRFDAPGAYSFLNPTGAAVLGINDQGAMVGRVGGQAVIFNGTSGATPLPVPAGTDSALSANAINNDGQICGDANIPVGGGLGILRAFRHTSVLGSVALPGPVGAPSSTSDINDVGEIVGTTGGFGGFPIRAVKWRQDNTLVPLGAPLGASFPIPFAVNNLGDAVGQALLGQPSAVLWGVGSVPTILNELLRPEDQPFWDLRTADDINDQRIIVGTGRFDPDGESGPLPAQSRAYALHLPAIPEPTSLNLAVFGAAMLWRARPGRHPLQSAPPDPQSAAR